MRLDPAVLLAGGRSSRLGSPKALRLVDGEPFVARQLRQLAAAGVARAVVVLGHDADRIRAALPVLPGFYTVVVNPEPERGSFSSLQCGLTAVSGSDAFVLPVDTPVPEVAVWAALREVLSRRGAVGAAKPVHAGRGGHPVLLSAGFISLLLALPPEDPEARLDRQLEKAQVTRVPVEDPGISLNLNSEGDWRAWENAKHPAFRA